MPKTHEITKQYHKLKAQYDLPDQSSKACQNLEYLENYSKANNDGFRKYMKQSLPILDPKDPQNKLKCRVSAAIERLNKFFLSQNPNSSLLFFPQGHQPDALFIVKIAKLEDKYDECNIFDDFRELKNLCANTQQK